MKKTLRLFCLALALVMLCLGTASCAQQVSATVSIKFIDGEGQELLVQPSFAVIGTAKEPPSALDAAEQVLQKYEKTYSLTDDGNSLAEAFGLKNEDSHDATTGYFKFWNCTVNGQNTESRQSTTMIYGGNEIVFEFKEGSKDREDTVAEETTNPADYETELITEEETEPEETEEVAE